MKRMIFTLTMLLVLGASSQVLAQDGSFLKEGKQWVFDRMLVTWEDGKAVVAEHQDMTVTIKGDTVIDGKRMKKLHVSTADRERWGYCALYEEGNKVYRVQPGLMQLVFDFNLEEGQALAGSGDPVKWKKAMTFGKNELMVYRFPFDFSDRSQEDVIKYCWVERVGSPLYWIEDYNAPACQCDYFDYRFKACYEDGECIFTAADFDRVDDFNGTRGATDIHQAVVSDTADAPVYDLQGRRITTPQKPGVYVRNGRKYVVK